MSKELILNIQARNRLLAADRQSDGVAQGLYRALRTLDPTMKTPRMKDTPKGMVYTFVPTSKLPIANIQKALANIEGGDSNGKDGVTFTTSTKIGVVYEESFTILSNDQEPESKLFQILHL
jgi:hypothetical protein